MAFDPYERLRTVIGPSPTEDPDAFLIRLGRARASITQENTFWKNQQVASGRKKAKKPAKKKSPRKRVTKKVVEPISIEARGAMAQAANLLGISIEELLKQSTERAMKCKS